MKKILELFLRRFLFVVIAAALFVASMASAEISKSKLKSVKKDGGMVTVSNFEAKWDPDNSNHLQFSWNVSPPILPKNYYIALEMWNTYNSSPLGSIESTVEELQEDGIGLSHVYNCAEGNGELYWGWDSYAMTSLPSLGTFRIRAYLLDADFNLVVEKALAYVELVVSDYTVEAVSEPLPEEALKHTRPGPRTGAP